MTYADVIIDISHEKVDRSFQYRVPPSLEDQLRVGMVVTVPFGKGDKLRSGYVTGFSEKTEYDPEKLKEIQGIRTTEETTESRLIELAAWMKQTCGSTMIQALKTVLPIQEKVKAREQKTLRREADQETVARELEQLAGGRCKARIRLLTALEQTDCLDYTRAVKDFGRGAVEHYIENGLLKLQSSEVSRKPPVSGEVKKAGKQILSRDQKEALEGIQKLWEEDAKRPVLLYGVTGSGKTRIYMELIRETLEKGQQVIVLIPEIALTYQTAGRFYDRFGERVSVINSRMPQGERYDQFKRARRGEVQIMVGPRSALFTPFSCLGLIIMDEEHEPTYKSETSPRYHAREAAAKRAQLEGARFLMGSATPSLEAYSRARHGEYGLVKLGKRFGDQVLPDVEILDLRKELKAGNRSVLGRSLKGEMEKCLNRQEQVMLFLNRRGYAGFVSCRSCGAVMKCPHCDVALSEHTGGRLLCHYCGYAAAKPQTCPVCGSPYFGGFKAGTQQIQQIIKQEFPEARVLRMDFDTTRRKGSYEEILASFAKHEADILIGTQMIVKGHDFPDVTLVGVIAADLSLNASDYRCAERTYQLLVQAVGRSGRGSRRGKAIIQTYHPEHYSVQAAARQDYEAFYEEEMGYRMLLGYPPASSMLAVMGSCEDEELLEQAMHHIEALVHRIDGGKKLHMIGPAPASIGKVRDVYRMVLYLRYDRKEVLIRLKDKLEQYIEINSGFRKIYIQFDFS